jgi:hypothetical protein
MSSKLKFQNGVLNHGQYRPKAVLGEVDQTARGPRPNIAREATRSKKSYTPVPVGFGMRDVSAKGHGLAFKGGKRPLDDVACTKLCCDAR